MLIGAHVSISGGYESALRFSREIGASACQFFTKNPMRRALREITDTEAESFQKSVYRNDVKAIVIHSSYLLNFAKKLSHDSFEVQSLAEDLRSAEKIGALGAVIHMGKHLELGADEAAKYFSENISHAISESGNISAAAIIENTAGQGTEMAFRLDEFGKILNSIKPANRVIALIDTAHLFAAGYDFRTPEKMGVVSEEISKHIGWERVTAIHLNDSLKPAGSRVDRHEDIGKGEIGSRGLKLFINETLKKNKNIPFILETPEHESTYKKEIALVRSWI